MGTTDKMQTIDSFQMSSPALQSSMPSCVTLVSSDNVRVKFNTTTLVSISAVFANMVEACCSNLEVSNGLEGNVDRSTYDISIPEPGWIIEWIENFFERLRPDSAPPPTLATLAEIEQILEVVSKYEFVPAVSWYLDMELLKILPTSPKDAIHFYALGRQYNLQNLSRTAFHVSSRTLVEIPASDAELIGVKQCSALMASQKAFARRKLMVLDVYLRSTAAGTGSFRESDGVTLTGSYLNALRELL